MTDVRVVVREKYGEIAEGKVQGCCATDCCGGSVATELGYTSEQTATLPEGADLGLGCGNPLSFADARTGETVVDLGSGAGIDCFLASKEVGASGHVIGVDMTASMIEKARANQAKGDYTNVEFRLGEIEHLPVADATVDLIVSNCVVNLSPYKSRVFRDAYRVLKPGGRILLSDLVLTRRLSQEQMQSAELYVGCVAGASLKDEYLDQIRAAGFTDVEIVSESKYTVGADALPAGSIERDAFNAVTSVKVRAFKPKQ